MALHFVSTSVLTSEDGIQFSKEVQLESEEAKKVRIDQERAANKPLFMQLAERNELKQQEYDNVKKLIFAPPKGLDDDEYEFLNMLESNKQHADEEKKSLEDKEIEQFKTISKLNKQLPDIIHHHHSSSSSSSSVVSTQVQQTENQKKALHHQLNAPPIMIVRKRKKDSNPEATTNKSGIKKLSVASTIDTDNSIQAPHATATTTAITATTTTATNSIATDRSSRPSSSTITKSTNGSTEINESKPKSNVLLSLVGDYPSDDDDDDDE